MARTAPVPDIPPIPGMCPSIAVLAGGGDGGGDSGDGNGDNNAGGSGSGEGAEGDQRNAPSPAAACGGSGGCTGPHGGASSLLKNVVSAPKLASPTEESLRILREGERRFGARAGLRDTP